ncbi:DNA-binding response regulator, NarL/FixJ family, contains REC and HTH domains [Mucilaginibacter gossypiicola]|uniref:DNA-binding response regulator, NarL/FixJ family, contains REC and HTH domains n=1 Tax=Mucilaginibacter gossypiicola TaxID=551995 RepID=A0A1H8T3X6_9SPHI|nr:response regulator transcription factor [Mucilaginibacter gossypiicola]SEO85515.1 DNA-binding response regulator, NarL/FixJ family, contains REC and HTH domains [Mucilaginibacter gossypiicola]
MKPIKIAIADDHTIYREGLKIGLTQDENLEVMLEAADGEDLVKGIETNMPNVIIMDLKMPVMDGMEATKLIKKKYPDIKILVVTMYDDEKFVIHLMEIGANGYLLKNSEAEEIRKAVYSVHETGYYFNNIVSNALLKKLVLKGNIKPSFKEGVELTEREQDVLKLICAEKTANEMGQQLFLSPRSVEGIRQRLIDKVGVRNTAGLVMFAVKNGII